MAVKVISEPGEKPKGKIKIISEPKAPEGDAPDKYRGTLLPLRKTAEGNIRPAVPTVLQDIINTLMESGKAATGQRSMDEMKQIGPKAALDVAGVGPATRLGVAGARIAGKAAPVAAEHAMPLINKAATKVGGVVRGGINSVDDVVKSARQGAQTRSAARTAEEAAIPSKDALRTAGGGELEAAKTIGGDIKPEVLQGRIGKMRENVSTKFDLNAEKTYPNTRDMIEYLERRAEGLSSFEELMTLRREAQNFVKRAKKAKETTGDGSDYAAAQRAMSDLEEFRKGLTADDMIAGDPEAANEALRKGNELWARQAKMDVVEDVISKAKRMNDPGYLQEEFRKIALDDYDMARFTDAERKLIDDIAADSAIDKIADIGTGVVGKVRKATHIGGTAVSGRIKKAEALLKEIAKGEADQTARAAAKAAKPSFAGQVKDALAPRPPNNTQTRRNLGR